MKSSGFYLGLFSVCNFCNSYCYIGMKRFTFDIIHRDSFPKQILIRFANSNDDEGDIFETLESCKKAVNDCMAMDVFISLEILKTIF